MEMIFLEWIRHKKEKERKILIALCSNMDILISGLCVFILFEIKNNLTDSTVWNTEETGDIQIHLSKLQSQM